MAATICLLTDEELDVLTGGARSPVATPYLDCLREPAREVARQTAGRSLMVRQILSPGHRARTDLVAGIERDGVLPAEVTGLVRVVLDLRAGARVVCALHRLVGAAEDEPTPEPESLSRYLHVVDDVLAVEDVTPQGVHTLALTRWDRAGEAVAEFLVPPDAGGSVEVQSDHREVRDRGDAAELLSALGHPTVLAEVAVLSTARRQAPSRLTLALGSAGCYVGREGPAGTRYRSTTADGVVEQVVAAVGAARRAAGG